MKNNNNNEYIDKVAQKMLKKKIINVLVPAIVVVVVAIGAFAISNKLLDETETVIDDFDLVNDSTNNEAGVGDITPSRQEEMDKILEDLEKEAEAEEQNKVEETYEEIVVENNEDVIVGNGEGEEEGINIFDWQNRMDKDVLYEKPFSVYSTDYVNVRLMPVISDNIIDVKEPGERVEVIGESEDGVWFRIKYGDCFAYVIKDYFVLNYNNNNTN